MCEQARQSSRPVEAVEVDIFNQNGSQPPSEDAVHCGQHSLKIYRLDSLPEQVNGETERGSAFGPVNVRTAGKAIDESITETSTEASESQQAEDDRNAPREVTPGKAFTIGSHKVLEGWKVKAESSFGDAEFQVTGKAKNVSEATSTMFIHIKFISKSGEVLGNVDCSTGDLEPGQTERMSCLSDGQFTSKYDKVTAEADF